MDPASLGGRDPLLLLRTLLALRPDIFRGVVTVSPAIPEHALPLELRDIIFGRSSVSVAVTQDTCRVEGLPPEVRLSRP